METFTPNSQDVRVAVNTILRYIGEDPTRPGLIDTPDRIVRMFSEIFRGYNPQEKPKITTFKNEFHSTEMVFDKGTYYSLCEHHMLPFFGNYYFAYIPDPNGDILGISKVARVVGYCAAKLQLQERLAHEIIDMLSSALNNYHLGMAIVMKGQHLCKTMRGVKNKGEMSVSYYTGQFRNPEHQRTFLQLISLNDG